MFDLIRQMMGKGHTGSENRPELGAANPAPGRSGAPPDEVAVAACALLLEIAHADGEFAPEERRHIESAMARHFNLDSDAIATLMAAAEAERKDSVDHFQFTRQIAAGFDLGQKTLLAEIMWGVILADGRIANHEEYLVRKVGNLLNLEPGYLSQARRAAGEKEKGQG
ncbi:MAG TPA: TerB family tellurite resistance protein [Candidatus Eisenbacteria bacterium]